MARRLPPGAHLGPARPVPTRTLPDLIVARGLASPSSVAVRQNAESLTYGDLVAGARRVAAGLRALGVGPGDRVGVTGERRPAMVANLLGVLLSGAAYVPLDPALPVQRRRQIASAAGIRALVTGAPADVDVPVLASSDAMTDAPCPADAGDPAYVMYTSGSTGTPKGVVVPHRALVAFADTLVDLAGLDAGTRTIGFASIGFDVSVIDLWVPLLAGGCVALVPADDRADPARLQRFLADHAVTFGTLPPALLPLLDPAALPDLRFLMTGTEAPGPEQVARWAGPNRRFFNCYGPTEATVQVTWFEADGAWDEPLPIGRPLPNHRVYVVDEAGRQARVGVPGELLVGGVGLALGYLDDPAATAERFVPDPFGPDDRVYRTGDLATWQPDGTLMFLGRLDRQVKVRGQRVETGEVEAVLRGHPGVLHAVVDVVPGPNGTDLVAFVTGSAEPDAVRAHVAGRLPAAMVPARIVPVGELPLGPTGKVDLDRLRELVPAPAPVAQPVADLPDDPTLLAVLAAWSEVLGVGPARPDDDFVELGGHSITAMRLVALLRSKLGRDLSVEHILGGRTPAAIAAAADAAGPVSAGGLERGRPPALSAAQRRLWFLDRYAPGAGSAYNIAFAERLRGPLDLTALARALAAVAARQSVLRWRLATVDGAPEPVLDPPGEIPLPVTDTDPDTLGELVAGFARQPFDLGRDRLWRAAVYRLGPEEHVLAVAAHHAVFDGWSHALFSDDLAAAYAAGTLPALPAGYGDYVAWRERRHELRGAADLAWWVEHLTGAPSTVDIPTDLPRPAEQTYRGAQVSTVLDPAGTAAVDALARSLGATVPAVLLAAFAAVLADATGSRDLVIGSPMVDRRHPDFEPMVGFCIEIAPLRLRPADDASFADLVRGARDEIVAALAHPEAPLDRVVEAFGLGGRLDRAPLVQVLFNMFSYAARPLALPGVEARPVPVPAAGSPFDLTVYGEHRDGRLRVEIVYNPDLFTADRMASMLGRVCAVLAEGVARPDRSLRDLGAGPAVPYAGPVLRPAVHGRRSAGEPPATATERAVAAVWSAVTGTAAVGVTDNFFEVGGSSMTAVAVQQRLNAGLGTALSVVDIFRYPTVRSLAARIDGTAVDRPPTDDRLDRAAQRGAVRRERAAARQRRGRTGRTP